MEQLKPPYLYHGSQHKIEILKPHLATGVGSAEDRLYAVYASHQRNFAIPFAFPIYPNEKGECSWSMEFKPSRTQVVIESGILDKEQEGYLYRVPSDTFEKIDTSQWVSYFPVKPLDYEIIVVADYMDWILKGAFTA